MELKDMPPEAKELKATIDELLQLKNQKIKSLEDRNKKLLLQLKSSRRMQQVAESDLDRLIKSRREENEKSNL